MDFREDHADENTVDALHQGECQRLRDPGEVALTRVAKELAQGMSGLVQKRRNSENRNDATPRRWKRLVRFGQETM